MSLKTEQQEATFRCSLPLVGFIVTGTERKKRALLAMLQICIMARLFGSRLRA